MSAEAQVTAIIESNRAIAEEKGELAEALAKEAQTNAVTVTTLTDPEPVAVTDFEVPPFDPSKDLAYEFNADYDKIFGDLEDWIRGLMEDWMNTYFPVLDPCIQPSEDAWLCAVVNDGYIGIPAHIETQIWDRARGREITDAIQLEDEAVSGFASMGYSMPQGALLARQMQVRLEAYNKSATINRELAIKNTEISVDMTKFAIGEMTKLRLGIAQALADFIRAWLALPGAAADIAKSKTEANRWVWDSASDYIRALVAKYGLELDADKFNSQMQLETQRNFVSLVNSNTQSRVSAAVQSAESIAKIASAAINANQSLGHVGNVTTQQG